ncbi:FAD/NAD(P)-binding domain-containing protein [Karstenula rhodostoma CBS 690.94]|uniref:FAD/NAD(P)-binding domain-containing protein n=1 Tax=Karstenula rhodostoma CBS 690.94 TaxID=1392251 RepID=A0A9P4PXV9_9PLEO|nr:FAD/NAD(P)-binding domain-containing protein [Karstenula rhodostoma CBS 690.94]
MKGNPIRSERPMRIVCIGAGASGLCFAYKLQRSFHNFNLTIYEKNANVGGVWFNNRYPGCECDYEAHNYTYSFEPKADYSRVYASSTEIHGYFEDFARKYGLHRYCKFGHRILSADWQDDLGVWRIEGEDQNGGTIKAECDILINATGILSSCKWPDIVGLDQFQGVTMHSGAWNESIDLTGKKVCLIGNGSSGQQILKSIQPLVSQLTVVIRQPTWIFGPFGEPQREYSNEEIQNFKNHPTSLTTKRKQFESRVNSYFEFCLKDSPQQKQIRGHLIHQIQGKLAAAGSTKLDESAVIPSYGVGCRRPTPGVGYIEALTSPNVTLVVGHVNKITATGIIDNANVGHKADILICATGFDTSYQPPFPIRGVNGKNLQDEWRERASGYLALAVPDMPNYFVFYGPNNPFASGAFLITIEAQADYMLKMCNRWQTENIHAFSPKKEAVEELQLYLDTQVAKTVWSDTCNSWYKPKGNAVPASLWPGSGLHYMEAISDVRYEDYSIRYKGSRFAWLGNGLSQVETDPECDLAYYIRERDDGTYLGQRKRLQVATAGTRLKPESLHVFGPRPLNEDAV